MERANGITNTAQWRFEALKSITRINLGNAGKTCSAGLHLNGEIGGCIRRKHIVHACEPPGSQKERSQEATGDPGKIPKSCDGCL